MTETIQPESTPDAGSAKTLGADGILQTQTDLAKYLGVHRKTVTEWMNSHNPPPKHKDYFVVAEIDEWYATKMRKPAHDENAKARFNLDFEKEKAKLRKEQALALQYEFKAAQLNPDFVPVVEVNQFLTSFFTELRRNALAIPPEMCATYPPEVRELVQADLQARLEMLLNYAADWVENWERAGSVEKDG